MARLMRTIVTGVGSNVGKVTAGALAAAGHGVVIARRTIAKAKLAAADMPGDEITDRVITVDSARHPFDHVHDDGSGEPSHPLCW